MFFLPDTLATGMTCISSHPYKTGSCMRDSGMAILFTVHQASYVKTIIPTPMLRGHAV